MRQVRFSLRHLLIAVALFAVLFSWLVTCSPKPDPDGMRVYWPLWGKEILDEGQEAPSGADHSEVA